MLEETLQQIGVNSLVARLAARNLTNKEVVVVGISGKIGSGKDTIAPLVIKALEDTLHLENPPPAHELFANPLKREVTEFIREVERFYQEDTLRSGSEVTDDEVAAVEAVFLEKFDLTSQNYQDALEFVLPELNAGYFNLDGWSRTPSIRKLLQLWGTEIRRTQDPEYWTKKALTQVIYSLSQGKSVYLTDVRFPNEVAAIQAIGGKVVRLDISPEFQKELAELRDGFLPNTDARNHVSEISLDEFEGFDVRIKVDEFRDKIDAEVLYLTDQLRTLL